MRTRFRIDVVVLVLALFPLGVAPTALSATSTVAGSNASRGVQAIGANNLKPPSCAGLTLTTLVSGTSGTSGNDLLIGSAGADVMNGAGGNDCIVGGGGNDAITGGNGTDVCIGGPGTDTFTGCETSIQ